MKPPNLLANLIQFTFASIMAGIALGVSLLLLQINAQNVQAAPSVQPLAAPCSSPVVTLTAVQDTWVDENDPNRNWDTDSNLHTKPDAGDLSQAFIQFDLSSVPTNSTINCATLRVYEQDQDNDQTIYVHRVTSSWNSPEATWLSRKTGISWTTSGGDFDPTAVASFAADTNGAYQDINVTSLVQFWVDNPGSNLGTLLRSTTTSSTVAVEFDSLENSNKPQLVVDYVSAPRLSINNSSSSNSVMPGGTITYTIVVSNDGNTDATGAVISDTLPVDTNFVSSSITLDPPGIGLKGTSPPTLASNLTITAGQQLTVTLTVTASTTATPTTIFTNTVAVTSTEILTPSMATNTVRLTGFFFPKLWVDQDGPITATVSDTVTFTYIVLNINLGDGSPISDITVTDNVAGAATYMGGDYNANNQLDKNEAWFYSVTYTVQATDTNPLVNTAIAQGKDQEGDTITSNNGFHSTTINFIVTTRLFFPIIYKNN